MSKLIVPAIGSLILMLVALHAETRPIVLMIISWGCGWCMALAYAAYSLAPAQSGPAA